MLLESGFLDTASLMFHFKNCEQPTLYLPLHPRLGEQLLIPKDDDVMINDAGKQAVKGGFQRLLLGVRR